jgi:hypothetical protein
MHVNASGATETTLKNVEELTKEQIYTILRLFPMLQSNSIVDGQQRQRITIDAITAALTLGTVSTITNAVPVGNVATIAGMDKEMFINQARVAYNWRSPKFKVVLT